MIIVNIYRHSPAHIKMKTFDHYISISSITYQFVYWIHTAILWQLCQGAHCERTPNIMLKTISYFFELDYILNLDYSLSITIIRIAKMFIAELH